MRIDERKEPPLTHFLSIGGQELELVLGETITIQGAFNGPEVTLRASATRHFACGDIAFDYPEWFVWEATIEGPNEKTWVLSGNDFKIMYFILPEVMSTKEFAKGMAQQFGRLNRTRISDTERGLGGVKHEGKLLVVKLAGTVLRDEVFALPAMTGSRLLVLQDCPPEGETNSEEAETTLAMVSRSFRDTSTRAPFSLRDAVRGQA